MRLLEKTFVKNGLTYEIISRSQDVGLFKLWLKEDYLPEPEHVGFEVGIIHKNKEWEIGGNKVEASESLTTNDQFGYDGSKSFFSHDKNLAWDYFYEFSEELRLKKAITMPDLPLYKGKTAPISKK